MVGGVMGGYWARGRVPTARAPARVMTMDSTAAKIGRSMKKRDMQPIPGGDRPYYGRRGGSLSFPNSVWERPVSEIRFGPQLVGARNGVSRKRVPKRSLGTRRVPSLPGKGGRGGLDQFDPYLPAGGEPLGVPLPPETCVVTERGDFCGSGISTTRASTSALSRTRCRPLTTTRSASDSPPSITRHPSCSAPTWTMRETILPSYCDPILARSPLPFA